MHRRTRWIFGSLLGLAALFALLAWIGARFILPAIVRAQVTQVLAAAGFDRATFKLERASPWSTRISALAAGDGALQIGTVRIAYSPMDAIGGRIDSVRISDGRFVLNLNELPSSPAEPGPASAPAPVEPGGVPLPVRSIEVDSCVLALRQGDAAPVELPLSGTLLRMPSGPAQLNIRAALGDAPLVLAGSIDTANGRLDLTGEIGGADLSQIVPLLPPKLGEPIAEASGTFDAQAHHRAAGHDGPARTSLKLDLHDCSISGRGDYAGKVRGLSASLALDSLSPLSATAGQKIAARSITIAGQEFEDALVEFQARSMERIDVSVARVRWANGAFAAAPFAIDLASSAVDLSVSADHVELAPVLALVTQDRATGSGSLAGRIAVAADWPRLRFGDGFIVSEGSGTIRLGSSIAAFGDMLDQTDPRFASDPQMTQVKQQVLEAMMDFQYDQLRADLRRTGDGGELVVALRIQGRGRSGARQPLDITLNLRGLEEGVNSYLVARSRVLSIGN